MKGKVISGEFGKILVRLKKDADVEIGELLISETDNKKILLQVYDLSYGSQISQINLELMAGMKLEEDNNLELWDEHLRVYNLAVLKNLLVIDNNYANVAKVLPSFFSDVREVKNDDMYFLSYPKKPLHLGKIRSGSKVLDVSIHVEADKVLSEHILIPATTGRGKSNLTSCMLWDMVDKDYCASLVLDPHDEYYGRNGLGLKDHPKKDRVVYYSPNPPPGALSLKINIRKIRPMHFDGAVNWTDAQKEAIYAYYKAYRETWIEKLMAGAEVPGFQEATIGVLRRRLKNLLSLSVKDKVTATGVFSSSAGETTISDICDELEQGKTVIVDTSIFSGHIEILINSLITTEIFARYKKYKMSGKGGKPVVSIVLEEAPRVLGKEVLEKGSNIFSTIAREGRKFKVGLLAITQLPSLIPRQILANMNTKIILGIEMAPERQAIIDSASQDLSSDARSIASLDKGEAIITSNFVKFAIPIKIPYFPDLVKETQNKMNKEKYKKSFEGVKG